MVERFGRVLACLLLPAFVAGWSTTTYLAARLEGDLSGSEPYLAIPFLAFTLVASVLLWRVPRHPVAWLLGVISLAAGVFPGFETWGAYVMTTRGEPDPLTVLGAWLNAWYWIPLLAAAVVYLPLLFPDGHLPSRRWRPVVWVTTVSLGVTAVLGMLGEQLHGQNVDYVVANPIGIAGLGAVDELTIFPVLTVGLLIGFGAGVAAVVVRFRRSRGVERQQLKWFLAALAPLPLVVVAEDSVVGNVAFVVVLTALPVAIGVAVLRYRLYDIDRLVSRTVTYTVVSGALVSVYATSVVALRPLLATAAGDSDVAVAASTLLAAALFGPIRRPVQRVVDRRFNRQRYDAARTAAAFALRLRDQVDLGALTGDLRTVVGDSLQPRSVSLWLAEPPGT